MGRVIKNGPSTYRQMGTDCIIPRNTNKLSRFQSLLQTTVFFVDPPSDDDDDDYHDDDDFNTKRKCLFFTLSIHLIDSLKGELLVNVVVVHLNSNNSKKTDAVEGGKTNTKNPKLNWVEREGVDSMLRRTFSTNCLSHPTRMIRSAV